MKIVSDALSYPFQGNGKYILLLGAILLILTDIASFAPLIGMDVMMVNGRTLGLLYRNREAELGWS